MIKAKFFNREGKTEGFLIVGHAGGRKGLDIFCAGVSALSQSVFLAIRDYLKREIEYESASGLLKLILQSKPDERTEILFQTLIIGLKEIQKINPEVIRLEIVQNEFY